MKWFRRKEKRRSSRAPKLRERRRGLLRKRPARWLEPVGASLRWMRVALMVGGPMAAAVALVWTVATVGASSRLFKAAEVEVKGLKQLERGGLLRRVGLAQSPNLLALDLNDVASRILSEPWVKQVKLERRLPGSLVVEVVERRPMAVVTASGQGGPAAVLVDGEGVVLGAAKAGDRRRFPVVVGAESPAPSPGSRFTDPKVASGLAVIQATEGLPLMGRKSLALVDCTYPGRIILKGRKSEAIVAVRGGNLERKFARLNTLAAELKRRHGSIEYIDLSFERRVIVKGVDKGT